MAKKTTEELRSVISKLKTPEACRNYAANARRLGREDLLPACLLREAELLAIHKSVTPKTPLEQRIVRDMRLLERLSGKPLSRTWPMIHRHGFIGMVERIVTKKGTSPGFELAVKNGVPEATFEQTVCDNPEFFSTTALTAARSRLEAVGTAQHKGKQQ